MGVSPHWMTVLLACLATYRITRFITADAFPLVAVPRRWIDKHWNPFPSDDAWDSYKAAPPAAQRIVNERLLEEHGVHRPTGLKRSIAYLVGCAWCTSIWVGAGVTAFVMIFIGLTWPWYVLLWLTTSAVTGMITQREPD
jgi:hypothetical protein